MVRCISVPLPYAHGSVESANCKSFRRSGFGNRVYARFCNSVLRLLLALFCVLSPAAAVEYSHRVWRTEDGLPQNRIQAITQTPDGYLWVGTSEGLARFDGVRFVTFDHSNTPAFTDDSIRALTPAPDGSLWIGTEGGGLLHYQRGVFIAFGASDGLTNGFVRAIFIDRANTLWIGTDRGFFKSSGVRFVRLDGTERIPLASVTAIEQDSGGSIWVAAHNGLLRVNNGVLEKARCGGASSSAAVRSLVILHDGILRTIDMAGASRIHEGCAVADPAFPRLAIDSVHEDSSGGLWIGTEGEGLIENRNGLRSTYRAPSILPDNTVSVIFEDREHNLWVGALDGLLRLSKTAITTVGSKDGIDDDNVSSIQEDRAGALWIVTQTGQIYRSYDGVVKRIRLPEPYANLRPHTVFQDGAGAYWFGTGGDGVVRLWHGAATRYTTADGLRSNTIRQIFEEPAGIIWIATSSGISRWDGHAFRNYYLEQGLSYPSVHCFASDSNGDVVVGTDAGLNRIHGGQIVRDARFENLSREKIWAIQPDGTGGFWLGTRGGGLLHLRGGGISRFTTRNGLPSNAIYQILDDGKGKLWMSSPAGIFSAALAELNGATQIHSILYGIGDGMETSQMNGGVQPSGWRTSSGYLWFASVRGAVRIDPAQLPATPAAPVLIERVLAGDETMPPAAEISIPPGRGNLRIDFTACNLLAPQRVSFSYKLEGFDEDWTPASRIRSASYTNLPPRHYRFRVVAMDAGDPRNSSEASVSLFRRPSFHQTAWFYALCTAVLALCVWAAFWLYARQTRARYALLLTERTRLAREMHDTVIQGCVGVSVLLEAVARSQRFHSLEAGNFLDQARTQVKATLEEAREAVWDLRHPSAAESSIPALLDLARKLGRENGTRVETEIAGQRATLDPATDRTLLLVGREALRNAVAHAGAARIDIRIAFESAGVLLEVRDDGKGFIPAEPGDSGNHFGIIGMRERVEQLGGKFILHSTPGAGTVVTATLPARSASKLHDAPV